MNKPNMITKPGEYLTKAAGIVVIDSISDGWARGYYKDIRKIRESWDASNGRVNPHATHRGDIVAPITSLK